MSQLLDFLMSEFAHLQNEDRKHLFHQVSMGIKHLKWKSVHVMGSKQHLAHSPTEDVLFLGAQRNKPLLVEVENGSLRLLL